MLGRGGRGKQGLLVTFNLLPNSNDVQIRWQNYTRKNKMNIKGLLQCTPGEFRTPNSRFSESVLYPIESRGHGMILARKYTKGYSRAWNLTKKVAKCRPRNLNKKNLSQEKDSLQFWTKSFAPWTGRRSHQRKKRKEHRASVIAMIIAIRVLI